SLLGPLFSIICLSDYLHRKIIITIFTTAEDGIGPSPVVVKPILEFQYIPAEVVVLLRLLLKLLFCVTKFYISGYFPSNLQAARPQFPEALLSFQKYAYSTFFMNRNKILLSH
ncbi:MAG: hypothetical protein WC512_06805, partial [Candidatus Omnitrophota bacterium]